MNAMTNRNILKVNPNSPIVRSLAARVANGEQADKSFQDAVQLPVLCASAVCDSCAAGTPAPTTSCRPWMQASRFYAQGHNACSAQGNCSVSV